MLSDLRFALRQIARAPGYTVVVVLTLALGIAVNTQIFQIVGSVFLRALQVRDADRAVVVFERSDLFTMPHGMSFMDFQDIRGGSKALTHHAATFFNPAHVSIPGHSPERMWFEAVTPDAFQNFGVHAALGRTLQPSDGELPPGQPVAVLTDRSWRTFFGADPAIVGRQILINTKPFTVVGVLAPGFESFSYSISAGVFIPSGALTQVNPAADSFFKYRSAKAWRVIAYRAPDATVATANAELATYAQRFGKEFPADHRNSRFQAVAERRARPDPSIADMVPVFVALFCGLVLLVLLIASANVANLMSVQALRREKELVVRAALGATRGRIIRQLLIESTLLALLAGVTGFYLSVWGGTMLQQFVPHGDVPVRIVATSNGSLLLFTFAISLLAGLASGLVPALRASRVDLNESLKQGAARTTATRHWMRNALVVGQVAVSCIVLVAGALFLRGLQAAGDLKLGFRSDHLLMVSFDVGLQGYDQQRGLQFSERLLEQVRALPGVEAATLTKHVPFSSSIQITNIFPENPGVTRSENQLSVAHSTVSPDFLRTMGIPLLRGRDLALSDDSRAAPVAVINEAMARALWPGRDAIGEHFHLDWNAGPLVTVVGVVPTGKYVMLTEEPKPYFYMTLAQRYGMPATLLVRTTGEPSSLSSGVRGVFHKLDPDLPVYDLVTFQDHLGQSILALMPLRMGATLAGVQGSLALILAILGLYAVVSYGVSSRTREIGVRVALGATQADVMRLVAREGLRLTAIGMALGLAFAALLSFGLSRVLYGIRPVDPIAFPLVIGALLATAAIACWLPARRAARVDPLVALRAE